MSSSGKVICNNCGRAIDINKLAEHIANCGKQQGFGGWKPKGRLEVPASKVEVV
jgi:hypothetical protein